MTPYFLNPERVELTLYGGEQRVLEYDYENGFEFEIEETVRCINAGLQESGNASVVGHAGVREILRYGLCRVGQPVA